ncbi:MAG: hypothetical protein ACJAQU_002421 [Loktanella salsilacus]|jgi:hypothetical protein
MMRVRLVTPHSYVDFVSIDENSDVVNLRCALQSGSLPWSISPSGPRWG